MRRSCTVVVSVTVTVTGAPPKGAPWGTMVMPAPSALLVDEGETGAVAAATTLVGACGGPCREGDATADEGGLLDDSTGATDSAVGWIFFWLTAGGPVGAASAVV